MNEVSIQLAEPEDAEILTEISTRSFDSDVEVGAPGKGGPPDYDSVENQRSANRLHGASTSRLCIMEK